MYMYVHAITSLAVGGDAVYTCISSCVARIHAQLIKASRPKCSYLHVHMYIVLMLHVSFWI